MLPSPGSVVAQRFVFEHLAGSGGMGAVYRARDLQDGGLVACKVLHLSNPSRSELERFAREAKLLSSLNHSGIVRYIAHGQTPEGHPFLAMEWLEGESLETLIQGRCLQLDEALRLTRTVAEALAAAHQRGIIHRGLDIPAFPSRNLSDLRKITAR